MPSLGCTSPPYISGSPQRPAPTRSCPGEVHIFFSSVKEYLVLVDANSYIFPAQDSTAACAVDVCDGVQAGHQQTLFLWSQCDVHSAARLPAQLTLCKFRRNEMGTLYNGACRRDDLHMIEQEGPAVASLERLHAQRWLQAWDRQNAGSPPISTFLRRLQGFKLSRKSSNKRHANSRHQMRLHIDMHSQPGGSPS